MPSGTDRTAASVTVTIARDPALVRTVRLVAASVARRAGRDEEFVEEVRLAAGEACALFLGESASGNGTTDGEPVAVTITIDDALCVDVSTPGLVDVEDHPDSDLEGMEAWALLRGLIDDFRVSQGPSQTTVSMRWPLS
ncbi:MAG TPA: ATP-binding protein [Nocardioidaceae bacterium]